MRISNIVEDIIPSNFWTASSKVTYTRYIRVGKMKIKYQGVLLLFEKLCKNSPATKALVITPLDDRNLYISSAEDVLHMIQAADTFVKSEQKAASVHPNSFHRHARDRLDQLQVCHLEQNQ